MTIPTYLRFSDLKARGIVRSWPQLGRLMRDQAFTRGTMLGANTRAWTEQEITSWLSARPEGVVPKLGNESKAEAA